MHQRNIGRRSLSAIPPVLLPGGGRAAVASASAAQAAASPGTGIAPSSAAAHAMLSRQVDYGQESLGYEAGIIDADGARGCCRRIRRRQRALLGCPADASTQTPRALEIRHRATAALRANPLAQHRCGRQVLESAGAHTPEHVAAGVYPAERRLVPAKQVRPAAQQ